MSLWDYLQLNFFTRLESRFARTVSRLQTALYRYFLVCAVQARRMDLVSQFFALYGEQLYASGDAEWHEWFALPVLAQPEQRATFMAYFTREWADSFVLSLSNFLATVFDAIPLPTLLNFAVERNRRKALEADVEALRSEILRMREVNMLAHQQLASLRAQQQQQQQAGESGASSPSVRSRGATFSPAGGGVAELPSETTEPFIVLSQEVFAEHEGAVARAAFSGDGASIASGGADRTVRLWTFSAFSAVRNATSSFGSNVLAVEWGAQSDHVLVCGTADREIRVWSVDEKRTLASVLVPSEFPVVLALACSPDDSMFVASVANTSTSRGQLLSWSLKDLKAPAVPVRKGTSSACMALSFNHNGRMLIAGGLDGWIRIFDCTTGEQIMAWAAHVVSGNVALSGVAAVRFTHDETGIVSHGRDGQLLRWSLSKVGSCVFAYNVPSNVQLAGLALDGDGGHFIVGTSEGRAAIYALGHENVVQYLGGHTGAVSAVDWHPTLNCVVTGSTDCTVRVSKLLKAV